MHFFEPLLCTFYLTNTAYIANFAKLINLAIENRNAFCQEVFEQNLKAIFDMMMQYFCGNTDKVPGCKPEKGTE